MPTGGTSASGGTGGATGGAGAAARTASRIDDMLGVDAQLSGQGYNGYWFVSNDGTAGGEQTPSGPFAMTELDPPRDGSTFAAKSTGRGFTSTWGASFGFSFRADDTMSIDASEYDGVSFWAKVGADSIDHLRVEIADSSTSPAGGTCDDAGDKCHDHFGTSITLDTEWQRVDIPFDVLAQQGFGDPQAESFTALALYQVQFKFGKSLFADDAAYEIWIDDIVFYAEE
jgi:hypothetical protein